MRYSDLFEASTDSKPEGRTVKDLGMDSWANNYADRDITSLEGCADKIKGDFSCSDNPLTSLRYGPSIVTGEYRCNNTLITSLEYAPHTVGDTCYFMGNKHLASLKGCPQTINAAFYLNHARITSFVGGPTIVKGEFAVGDVPNLQSYEGAPKFIGEDTYITALPSLQNFNKHFPHIGERLTIYYKKMPTNLLSIVLVASLQNVRFQVSDGGVQHKQDTAIGNIISKYLGGGRKGMMLAQAELVQNGLEDYAAL
jgi:hypothetical protein